LGYGSERESSRVGGETCLAANSAHSLPESVSPKPHAKADIAALKAPDSWILHAHARTYYWRGSGQLSVKTFFGGRAHYRVGLGHHALDETSYLVLNETQSYEISIEARQPVESFCIFFTPGLAEDVERSLSTKASKLLDEPHSRTSEPVRFFERNYTHDQILSPELFRLRQNYKRYERARLGEQFHAIVERLLMVHRRTWAEVNRLDNVRIAVREELYRRVSRARDYMTAMFAEPLRLTDIARVACLSPNHFLRTFRSVFGTTPHQFLTDRRLQEARRLLAGTELTVTEICFATGFESLGSFSWLFRQRHGLTPSQYRCAKK
jgi:AraC family transcriptional regulator